MKFKSWMVLGFCCLMLNGYGQEISEEAQVATYLDSNGSMLQYQYAFDELLKILQQQYPKSENNLQGWAYLEGYKDEAVAQMKTLLIPIYRAHFSKEEIKTMTAFYQSDAGKQLVTDRSKMSELQKETLNGFFNSEVGKKILEKQDLLSKEISQVSENWSRELYETSLSLLKNE